jgi:hypothetical protein
MAAPVVWVADVVALLEVVVARMLVLEEIVEEGEVEGRALLDVKLLEGIVDVETDPVLEPPREVALVTVVEPVNVVESPAELPSNVEVPLELESGEDPLELEVPESVEDPDVVELAEVEVPEPELPVMPSRL